MSVDCTPKSLAEAARCFCLDKQSQAALDAYLLCQIANAGGETFYRIDVAGNRRVTVTAEPRVYIP